MPTATRLHQAATSSASWRVRIALAIKGIDYEPVWLDLAHEDNLAEPYAAVAVTRQVPCLEIDGLTLLQSLPIIEYLDETRPAPALLPATPGERARVRAVAEFINAGIQPMHNIAVRRRLRAQFQVPEAEANAWCRHWIELRFAALERMIEHDDGPCACGTSPSLADILVYPQVMTSARFGVDLAAFPRLARLADHLRAMPAFGDSHASGGG